MRCSLLLAATMQLGGIYAAPANAGDLTSPSFTLRGATLTNGGTSGSTASGNTLLRGATLGQPAVDISIGPSGIQLRSGFWATVFSDLDRDGVADARDNCVTIPNQDQFDINAGEDDDSSLPGVQSYGDECDADLDNDGVVGASDFFSPFRPCLGADPAVRPECASSDFDRDGVVGPSDFFGSLRPNLGSPPGPGVTE